MYQLADVRKVLYPLLCPHVSAFDQTPVSADVLYGRPLSQCSLRGSDLVVRLNGLT